MTWRLLLLFGCITVMCSLTANSRAELILHVPMDAGTITGDEIADIAGGNSGILQSDQIGITTGVDGDALEFEGFDTDYVDFGNDEFFDPGAEDFSVSVWFDADPEGNAEFVVSKGNSISKSLGWSIWMEQGSVFARGQQLDATDDDRFGMHQTNVDAGVHHVVLVLDRTEDRIFGYLDGRLMENAGGGGSQTDLLLEDSEIFTADSLLVGRRTNAGAPLTGWVDDLQIYRQALAADDVAFLFENPGAPLTHGDGCCDFNGDGALDLSDIDLLRGQIFEGTDEPTYDVTGDGRVNFDDLATMVEVEFNTWVGDANLDGEFNSGDLVSLLSQGEYEDAVANNSTWSSGDFNADGDFDTSDLVSALAGGGYEQGPRAAVAAVPEPAAGPLLGLALLGMLRVRRRR